VPILGENDVTEPRRDAVNGRNYSVAVSNGERAGGAEVVLHIDDQEYVMGSDFHLFSPLPLSQTTPASEPLFRSA
jgi:hypothetical protein